LVASLCMVRSKLCARTSTTESRPSPGRGPPGVDGPPNQAARATVFLSVNFKDCPVLRGQAPLLAVPASLSPSKPVRPHITAPDRGGFIYLNLAKGSGSFLGSG
jgi:hypothetical protein